MCYLLSDLLYCVPRTLTESLARAALLNFCYFVQLSGVQVMNIDIPDEL